MKFLYIILIMYPFIVKGQLFAISRVLRDKNNMMETLKKTSDPMDFFSTSEIYDNRYFNEPSCEDLLAMWRFSKRQARSNELTNEIPAYTRSLRFPHSTMYKPFFFGRIKNALTTEDKNKTKNRDPKTRMINGNTVDNEYTKGKLIGKSPELIENPSSFDRLKALMFSERVRNLAELQQRQQEVLRGVNLRGLTMGSRFQQK